MTRKLEIVEKLEAAQLLAREIEIGLANTKKSLQAGTLSASRLDKLLAQLRNGSEELIAGLSL